jgi:hypothetical protein
MWANFQRIIELFDQKIVTKLSKVWVWDPGSGKNLFGIPDPGVKKAQDPGSRIRIHNTASFNHPFVADRGLPKLAGRKLWGMKPVPTTVKLVVSVSILFQC